MVALKQMPQRDLILIKLKKINGLNQMFIPKKI